MDLISCGNHYCSATIFLRTVKQKPNLYYGKCDLFSVVPHQEIHLTSLLFSFDNKHADTEFILYWTVMSLPVFVGKVGRMTRIQLYCPESEQAKWSGINQYDTASRIAKSDLKTLELNACFCFYCMTLNSITLSVCISIKGTMGIKIWKEVSTDLIMGKGGPMGISLSFSMSKNRVCVLCVCV